MLPPPAQPGVALRKKTSRKPSEAGETSCQDSPPSRVRSTTPPPTESYAPAAKAVSGSIACRPLKVNPEISNCLVQVFPPLSEWERTPALPPKKASAPAAHPVEVSAKETAIICPNESKPRTDARTHWCPRFTV